METLSNLSGKKVSYQQLHEIPKIEEILKQEVSGLTYKFKQYRG